MTFFVNKRLTTKSHACCSSRCLFSVWHRHT